MPMVRMDIVEILMIHNILKLLQLLVDNRVNQ